MRCWNCGEEIGEESPCPKCGAGREDELARENMENAQEAEEPRSEAAAEKAILEEKKPAGEDSGESEPQASDDVKKKPKRMLYGGLAVAAVVILAVFVFVLSGAGLQIRKAGAWPDFPYLASLIDRPDDFVRALNCPDLQEAYNAAKRDEDWDEPLVVEIDIDGLEPNDFAGEVDNAYPLIEVRFNSEGLVDYFHLVYAPPTVDNDLNQLTASSADEWSLHQTVAFNLLSKYGYGSTEVTEDELEAKINQIRSECTILQPFTEEILADPSSILERCGFEASSVQATNEAVASADWRQGYLRAFQAYVLAVQSGQNVPPITTGMRYEAWFEADGISDVSFFYQAQDFDMFVQDEGFTELHVGDSGMLCLGFCRDGYWEPAQGTDQNAAWANSNLNALSIDLWSVSEGAPTDSGIEG